MKYVWNVVPGLMLTLKSDGTLCPEEAYETNPAKLLVRYQHLFIYSCHAEAATILFSHSQELTSVSQEENNLAALTDIPTVISATLTTTQIRVCAIEILCSNIQTTHIKRGIMYLENI